MGTKAQEIITIDRVELIGLLNTALADEWFAYYQYWIGSKVIKGMMRTETTAELIQHANDELRHAGMLADRIAQLGGTPVLEPKQWYDVKHCGYDAPTDPHVAKILQQNISGEQCAIEFYNKLLKKLEGKDFITYQMITTILADEIEHEEDLQNLAEDLATVCR
jgi:bacterioferritin